MSASVDATSQRPVIVWFRNDLRVSDHPALSAAAAEGRPIVPVHVLDDVAPGAWRMGGASRWWLHGSLESLGAALAERGVSLVLRRGEAAGIILDLAREVDAGAIYWNRHVEPHWQEAEGALKREMRRHGGETREFPASLLFQPEAILSRKGEPLRVFTPFWKTCLAAGPPPAPLPAPRTLNGIDPPPAGDNLDDWRLLPTRPDWAGGLRETWRPGEAHGLERLRTFVDEGMASYGRLRNRPEPTATSMLSPYLRFGEVSPRQVWHVARMHMDANPGSHGGGEAFLREVGWRDFCAHLLVRTPTLADEPMQPRFNRFPWQGSRDHLTAWQRGRTGYPIVDAGMRQLWHTGWMHNRVRMIVASFLVKDLLLPWQWGEAWFWDTLVDADMANNAGGWQWVAGCGADAAPYFRVFNPVLQGEKFDPDGAYARRWVPELAELPDRWIHKPWEAPPLDLEAAGVRLGGAYPLPLVEHKSARLRALAAFQKITANM
jgi:deoxyribodipyrimidine photo-lyase